MNLSLNMRVTITNSVFNIVGLDDYARYPDLERRGSSKRFTTLEGPMAAFMDLKNEIYDRATEGDGGYDHSPREQAMCRRAFNDMERQGVPSTSGRRKL